MSDVAVKAKAVIHRFRLLQRGESIVVFTGVALAVTILVTVGLIALWVGHSSKAERFALRDREIRSAAQALAVSAETLLAADDLSGLRRVIIDSARGYELAGCRIVLPNGLVLADGDPTKITTPAMPTKWPSGPLDVESPAHDASTIAISQPLKIPGKGAAILQMTAGVPGGNALSDVQLGVVIIGVLSLAAMLVVYRRVRRKMLTLGLIRDSLLAKVGGLQLEALEIDPQHGPEAVAWNSMLSEAVQLKQMAVAENATSLLRARSGKRTDLEFACDALSVGVMVIDEQMAVKTCNGAAANLLAIKRDQLTGSPLEQLFPDPEIAQHVAAILRGAGQRKTFVLEPKDAEAAGVLRINVRPLRREDSGGALLTIEDITQQRVAEASRSSFIAHAAHELRTPLTNMRLSLETILEEPNVDQATVSYNLNILNQETRRLERMVSELLSVSEIEAGSLKLKNDDVKLDKVLEEIHRDFASMAKDKQIELSLDLPPKLPTLHGDRDKLMLTLQNLIANAIKYTPPGGKCNVLSRAGKDEVTVEVVDTGFGIDPSEQELIFQRFYRAKDPRVAKITGTGLGLALAREVVRLHGGDVTVKSELNKGSTFVVNLPCTAMAA